ncbi:hypothetical protein KP509_33G056700 [Ceratopteris richardii]|uniref:t-SNARE coiled-coil homology domain-containing protein n=1 Tax=Ceratopteris richardii TaxID=49495 RepID=A0A8T2QRF2_CERRI|nr:hypothetical protein KP509_33G056700 [Ceratopteris richardii]
MALKLNTSPCRHKTRQHIGGLAKDISGKLKAANEVEKLNKNARKRITDAKLAKDFQAILNDFQNAQRISAEKEATYAPLLHVQVSSIQETDALQVGGESQERYYLLAQQRRQELIQLENEVVFNEAIIEERDQGIKDIQQQIGEVNEIFKDLAHMVREQGIMIYDIDSSIGNTHSTTTQANVQLVRAANSQKANSSLICWLLVAFGITIIIVVIVLVLVVP